MYCALRRDTDAKRHDSTRSHHVARKKPPAPTHFIISLAKFCLGVFSACSLIAMGWL